MQRPASVTVFGILNIVFAGIGALGILAIGLLSVAGHGSYNFMTQVMQGGTLYAAWIKLNMVLGFVSDVVLLVAGIGLLMLKSWARIASIAFAIFSIVMMLIGEVVNCIFPVQTTQPMHGTRTSEAIGYIAGNVGFLLGIFVGLVYPILLLVFMRRASVIAAFCSPARAVGYQRVSEPSPVAQKDPAPNRLGRFAAVFSISTPFIAISIYLILFQFLMAHGRTTMTTMMLVSLCAVAMIILGFAFGMVGLAMVGRRQSKSLFASALIGVGLNGLLFASLVIVPFLLPLTIGHKYPTTVQGRLAAATQKLAEAPNEEQRFYALDVAAKESFNAGKIEDADKDAKELLKLAPQFQGNWNYGNAIQDGNLVLGCIAVREGHIDEAKQYLLAAGNSPGSPTMDSFGPNMSLAKDLLEKGQREVVLQYFGLCRKFWKMDYGKLDQWSKEVEAGQVPDFGANLVY
jgi:hypothetical protein